MEFNLVFSNENNENIFDDPIGEIGLDMVDLIREQLNLTKEECPIGLINSYINCPSQIKSYVLHLNEEEASKIPFFRACNTKKINVKPLGLSKYCWYEASPYYRYRSEKNLNRTILDKIFNRKGYVEKKFLDSITLKHMINSSQILADWKSDGCPIRWF